MSQGFSDLHPRRLAPLVLLFRILLAIALVSCVIGIGGRWLGGTIAAGGHTESRVEREVVVGNNVFLVPENAIRFAHARRNGDQPRLDLYLRWPNLDGYTSETRDEFNNVAAAGNVLFVSFEPRMLTLDMSARLGPIYSHLMELGTERGPAGLSLHRLRNEAGFVDEVLLIGARAPEKPFVARCLSGEMAADALVPCERDIHFGEDLSLVYRFPEALLTEWPRLDRAVLARAAEFLQTDE